ncbi:MAG TPA: methyltransferase domain-containing protein [Saprospiraceae bacterium]|nr:methyltransferase domain-containing protein [Saprospiraceae bacterium]
MISRRLKAAFYSLAGPLMKLNGVVYKSFRSPSKGDKKRILVQLGPGKANYLNEWINVDANIFSAKIDVWGDLRNPLPFKDNSVDFFYSHHVVEHLPDLESHFKSMFKSLKPGGKVRIGGPNGDSAINRFIANDSKWFGDFPYKRTSIGGRFENFVFCRQEHLTILTFSYLEELFGNAGFIKITNRLPVKDTGYPEIIDQQVLSKEWEDNFTYPHTLIIEAEKPINNNEI